MKIALFYEESSGISSSITDVGRSFELLGHDVVFVDAADDLRAHNFLKREGVDFIFGYKEYSFELSLLVCRLASFLSIPIIDFDWCCHNLSMLIGGRDTEIEGANFCNDRRDISSSSVFV